MSDNLLKVVKFFNKRLDTVGEHESFIMGVIVKMDKRIKKLEKRLKND